MLVNAFPVFRTMQAEFDLESRFKHSIYLPAGFGEFYPSTCYACLEPNLLLFDVVEVGLLETFEDNHWQSLAYLFHQDDVQVGKSVSRKS